MKPGVDLMRAQEYTRTPINRRRVYVCGTSDLKGKFARINSLKIDAKTLTTSKLRDHFV